MQQCGAGKNHMMPVDAFLAAGAEACVARAKALCDQPHHLGARRAIQQTVFYLWM